MRIIVLFLISLCFSYSAFSQTSTSRWSCSKPTTNHQYSFVKNRYSDVQLSQWRQSGVRGAIRLLKDNF